VIEPSQMTGSASECQNCYPPKDEVCSKCETCFCFVLFSILILFSPKGEVKSLRENGFLGGRTGGV
jgi:hypothetical protein